MKLRPSPAHVRSSGKSTGAWATSPWLASMYHTESFHDDHGGSAKQIDVLSQQLAVINRAEWAYPKIDSPNMCRLFQGRAGRASGHSAPAAVRKQGAATGRAEGRRGGAARAGGREACKAGLNVLQAVVIFTLWSSFFVEFSCRTADQVLSDRTYRASSHLHDVSWCPFTS